MGSLRVVAFTNSDSESPQAVVQNLLRIAMEWHASRVLP
jgi:hypothetical protein